MLIRQQSLEEPCDETSFGKYIKICIKKTSPARFVLKNLKETTKALPSLQKLNGGRF